MSPSGFEPTISAGERPQTYALERAATGTGLSCIARINQHSCLHITVTSTSSVINRDPQSWHTGAVNRKSTIFCCRVMVFVVTTLLKFWNLKKIFSFKLSHKLAIKWPARIMRPIFAVGWFQFFFPCTAEPKSHLKPEGPLLQRFRCSSPVIVRQSTSDRITITTLPAR